MNPHIRYLVLLAILAGIASAQSSAGIVIPPDQPICRLYGLIQAFGTIAAVIAAAVAGFNLASSHDIEERNRSKMILSGVVIGLVVIWLAPLAVQTLVGASNICGW